MIKFQKGNNQFNFRSVAILIKDNRILIQKDVKDDFWALPGGRVEFFENADEAVVREIQEELGWKCKVIRPVWFAENFFQLDGTHFHEIATFFLLELIENKVLQPNIEFRGNEDHLVFKWADLSEVPDLNLKPDTLKSKLKKLPEQIEFLKINNG